MDGLGTSSIGLTEASQHEYYAGGVQGVTFTPP